MDKYCIDKYENTCIGYTSMCKAYCGGGVIYPRSKPMFFSTGFVPIYPKVYNYDAVYNENGFNIRKGQPSVMTEFFVELCIPTDACLGQDKCTRPYMGMYCASCRWKYFRAKGTTRCIKCGWIQKMGSIIMAGVVVFLTVGSLCFAIITMKFQADLRFKTVLITVIKTRIQKPIVEWVKSLTCYKRRMQKKRIRKKRFKITKPMTGSNIHYAKKQSLGISFQLLDPLERYDGDLIPGKVQLVRILPMSV